MDKVTIIDYDRIYKNFIDEKYLHDGHDEYYSGYTKTSLMRSICMTVTMNIITATYR